MSKLDGLLPALKGTQITVICDVTNPLLGENGATAIYGPQKGATPETVAGLEAGMASYARLASAAAGRDIAHFPGAGAAGGLGAALGGVLGATMKSGIDAVLEAVGFDALLEGASLVVTGEGRIDSQSVRFGKVPVGVARHCAAHGVPVAAIVGGIGEGAEELFGPVRKHHTNHRARPHGAGGGHAQRPRALRAGGRPPLPRHQDRHAPAGASPAAPSSPAKDHKSWRCTAMIPKIVKMDIYPVAGHDSMELNLSGAHAPFFTRNIVVLEDSSGNLGVGEVPRRPEDHRRAGGCQGPRPGQQHRATTRAR